MRSLSFFPLAISAIAFSILSTFLTLQTNPSLWIIIILFVTLLSAFNPYYGFITIIFLPVLGELSRFDFFGQSMILSDIIIPIYFIIWLFHKKTKIKISDLDKKILIPIMFFLLTALSSLLISMIKMPINEAIKGGMYFIRLIVYLSLIPITLSFGTKKNIQFFLIFSATLLALSGFIQLIVYPDLSGLETLGYDPHINRLTGTWLDPNFIGGFFAITVTMLTAIFFSAESKKNKTIIALLIGLFLMSVIFTYSRSAYLCLGTGLIIISLFKSRFILLSMIVLTIITYNVSERAEQRLNELVVSVQSIFNLSPENPDPTARLRIENWNQSINLIKEKPILGHGYNNLIYAKHNYGYIKTKSVNSASGSDSSVLTITATTGIIGLSFFLWFLYSILKESLKNYLNKNNTMEARHLSIGIFASINGLLVHSIFVNSLFFAPIMIYSLITLGVFLNEINKKSQ